MIALVSRVARFAALGVLSFACATSAPAQVTPPADHLGRPLAADFELADWTEVSGYFQRLARESPRVRLETVGTTTEGRAFLLAVISSEENLAQLPRLREHARRVADPRGLAAEERAALLDDARPFLFISIAMHSTETAAPQFGMEFAWKLATSDDEPYRSARERAVVLLAPCLNPDGLDHVVSWYRRTVGTPYEASGLTELYQQYAGHDNNRDWFMLNLQETRLVSRLLYHEWFPQVYWDVHQQGKGGERMFIPPFRDPLDPNLDPGVMAGIDALSSRALLDLTSAGRRGVATGVTFDMWWNGGNRNVPVRHNMIGLLTEAASVDIASPVFLRPGDLRGPGGADYAPSHNLLDPWPGGWWRLRDIVDYELAFGESLLASLAREPRLWLEITLRAAERAATLDADEAPVAWIIPSTNRDVGAARRLAESLLQTGVELHVAEAAFHADTRAWPAGSIVILADQPYSTHVKDLFEIQRYPDGSPPYDVSGWTLPLLMGVERAEVMHDCDATLRPVGDAAAAVAGFHPEGHDANARDLGDSDTWRALIASLGAGLQPTAGTSDDGRLLLYTKDVPLDPGPRARQLRPRRIGIYAPWTGSMDEGWMRFVFDSFGLPYVRIRNEHVRAGGLLDQIDVLVLPDVNARELDRGRPKGSIPDPYAEGLAPEGAHAIAQFVRDGGTVIAMDGSARWMIDLLRLPLADATRGADAKEFSCPGSVVAGIPADHELCTGLPAPLALFFADSSAFEPIQQDAKDKDAPPAPRLDVLLRYAPSHTLLSGWLRRPETIAGKAAWVRAQVGRGRVHLFGFRPHYRGWPQQTFHLLFRALLLDG